jgi:hypothetical protein
MTGRAGCKATAVLTLLLGASAPAGPVPVQSTFDRGAEGWWVADIVNETWEIVANLPVNFSPSAGNPDGCIWKTDPSGLSFHFAAPEPYLGDATPFIGGRLRWDIRNDEGQCGPPSVWGVILVGGDFSIRHGQASPCPDWATFQVPLSACGWTNINGDEVTDGEFAQVLASLTALLIEGDWGLNDTAWLDNVIMMGLSECPADVTGDGTVDVQDLVAVILAWGTADATADVNGSCLVDVSDLVEVILDWGPCR